MQLIELRKGITRRIVILALLIIAIAILTISLANARNSPIKPKTWPSFTMVYEASGEPISAQGLVISPLEIHSLQWNGPDDWYDVTTTAESFTAPIGTVTRTGSWKRFDGQTFTRFDSLTGSQFSDQPQGAVSPQSIIHPVMAQVLKDSHDQQPTTASRLTMLNNIEVCYQSQCLGGLTATEVGHPNDPFVFTARGIPLRAPGGFKVLSLKVDAPEP